MYHKTCKLDLEKDGISRGVILTAILVRNTGFLMIARRFDSKNSGKRASFKII